MQISGPQLRGLTLRVHSDLLICATVSTQYILHERKRTVNTQNERKSTVNTHNNDSAIFLEVRTEKLSSL